MKKNILLLSCVCAYFIHTEFALSEDFQNSEFQKVLNEADALLNENEGNIFENKQNEQVGSYGYNEGNNTTPGLQDRAIDSNSTASEIISKLDGNNSLPELHPGPEQGQSPGQMQRTCDMALKRMLDERLMIIDMSKVVDFAEKGRETILNYYKTIKDTNSYGTKSNNIYVNLSQTEVSAALIEELMNLFINDGKNVILNLSHNKSVDDNVVRMLFSGDKIKHIHTLSLSETNITDDSVNTIGNAIERNGICRLNRISLSGNNISPDLVNKLKDLAARKLEEWKQQHPKAKNRKLQIRFMPKRTGNYGNGMPFGSHSQDKMPTEQNNMNIQTQQMPSIETTQPQPSTSDVGF